MTCDIVENQNGFSVSNIHEIHECGDTPFVQKLDKEEEGLNLVTTGVVKLYMDDKEFGFIVPEDGVKDIFVHKSCLSRAGIDELLAGQVVRVHYKTVAKGREATSISILSNP